MAYETILTILFAIGVGATIIVYAARPRHGASRISVAHASAVGSYSPAEAFEQAPMPQVTAVQTPAIDTSTPAEVHAFSETAPAVVAEVAAAGPSESFPVATSTADVSAAASIATSEPARAQVHAAKAPRTQRRKSTATKTHASVRQPAIRCHAR